MKTFGPALAALAAISLAAPRPAAAVTLILSSPDNLSDLTVGQEAEVDVTLSGLPANDSIFNLNSRVLFPSALLTPAPDTSNSSGLTAVVAPGSVFDNPVRGPLQVGNFYAQSSLTAGAANGIFAESPNTNSGAIALNGLYYSFEVKAAGLGSGAISFDPTPGSNEYAADDTGFNYAPLTTGAALDFTVNPAAAAAPEPSPLTLLALTGAGLGGLAVRARRRNAAA